VLREIGSDFWDTPTIEKPTGFEIKGIDKVDSVQYYFSGRNAIRSLCRQIKSDTKKVLLPSFTCETVIKPFEKEEWLIDFYDINKNLQVNVVDLLEKISTSEPDVIYFQNYFGFCTLVNVEEVLKLCQAKNIIVVEDITQSLLSEFEKIQANYYVGSLRKFFAIYEGGILISRDGEIEQPVNNAVYEVVKSAKEAFLEKKQYMNEICNNKKIFLEKYNKWKSLFVMNDDIFRMNEITGVLLEKFDYQYMIEKRRENYLFLYKRLKEVEYIQCIFDDNLNNVAPLFFPIYVNVAEQRDYIQKKMAENNVYCPIVWPQYISNNLLSNNSIYIYKHILCIPCDYRYDFDDMSKIVSLFNENSSFVAE